MTSALFTLADWRAAYAAGADPADLLAPLMVSADNPADTPTPADPAWIHRCSPDFIAAQLSQLRQLRQLREAAGQDRTGLPLYGVPFAVKDNIDVAGLITTAACPAFAHVAEHSATVVLRLMAAGAVLVGKTNLDQFATGLVGTRSPYGEVPNSFDGAYVSGGSSSGSASVVARGLVVFALGTDTAGSGRVPAGLNNLVGLKPTPGRVPMAGVLPACRTLDVVSVLALTVADAAQVMAVIEGADDEPGFQRFAPQLPWLGGTGGTGGTAQPLRVGVPAAPACDPALGFDTAFDEAVAQLRTWGLTPQPIDMTPLFEVARLLYDGPWVAERYAVLQALIEQQPEVLDPTVRQVIERARGFDAVATFRAQYALAELRQRLAPLWQQIDVLMVPTTPTCPTRAAVAAEPVLRNSELGRFTNFVNLLGQAALALPSSLSASGLPFGVTFIAPGGSDAALVALGARWEAARAQALGCRLRPPRAADTALHGVPAAAPTLALAVVGAHLAGLPLHGQLVERGCRLRGRTRTAPHYRLYALPGTQPPKPGLTRVNGRGGAGAGAGTGTGTGTGAELDSAAAGHAIEVEVYDMPLAALGSFLALIAPPLGLGSLQLADGSWVKGFLCEGAGLVGASDISAFGGWRAYLAAA